MKVDRDLKYFSEISLKSHYYRNFIKISSKISLYNLYTLPHPKENLTNIVIMNIIKISNLFFSNITTNIMFLKFSENYVVKPFLSILIKFSARLLKITTRLLHNFVENYPHYFFFVSSDFFPYLYHFFHQIKITHYYFH